MIDIELFPSEWALAYFIFEWILRLGFIPLILPHREPAAARIWLLFAFLAPVPAAVAYALIGRLRNPRRRQAREERAARAREVWFAGRNANSEQRRSDLEAFVESIGGNPPAPGSRIELLTDYDHAVDALVAAIDQAEERVLILTYIFADDRVGQKVIAALARARARGLAVHVMLDALGSRPWRGAVLKRLKQAGVEARACNLYNPFKGGTGRLDRRNHRKIYVIDDQRAFIGSQNIAARDFRRGVVNYELMVHVEGPLARDLAAQFVIDLYGDGGPLLTWPDQDAWGSGQTRAQMLASGPDREVRAYTLLLSRLIQEAREAILIVSPYLVLDGGLRLALVTAALRGVKVTVLLSAVVDQPLVRLAQEAGYASLLWAGIGIRHYEPGLLHAKYILVDGERAIIGSSNADIRSLQINSEVSLVSEDPALVSKLVDVAQEHLSQSSVLTPEEWDTRPRGRRAMQRVAALAIPLL